MQEEAVKVMDQFGWGAEFLRVNADVLETYAACADGAEVVAAQVSASDRYTPTILRSKFHIVFGVGGSWSVPHSLL